MDRTECLNALDIALENEMSERKFYLHHADRTRNPVGKAMFIQIANDELEHYKQLMQVHERWKKAESWPVSIQPTVNETKVTELLDELIRKQMDEPVKDDDDLAAIEKALAFEEQGVDLYTRLRDSVTDEKEKAFFGLLASVEQEHYLSLKKTKEFLMSPETWMVKKMI